MSKPQNKLNKTGHHNGVSRRDFFNGLVQVSCAGAIAAFVPSIVLSRPLPPPNQNNWRSCNKCRTLFYNGFKDKGRCPAGRRHEANLGGQFVLTYDSPGPGQVEWRFCSKCFALFFNGFPNKGICAAGGAHFAQGFNFTLLHDTRAAGHQPNWRFCKNCEVLFYDGDSNKGVCSAGGGHVAAGFKFILKFRGNLEGDVQLNPVSP